MAKSCGEPYSCGCDICTTQSQSIEGDSYSCEVPLTGDNHVTINEVSEGTLDVDLSDATVAHIQFDEGTTITNCDLSNGEVRDLDATGVTVETGNFNNAEISDSDFTNSVLKAVSMAGTAFKNAVFAGAQIGLTALFNANFLEADPSKPRSLGHGEAVEEFKIEGCSFRDVDLAGTHIINVDFVDCEFSNVKVSEETGVRSINITNTTFADCSFSGTNVEPIGLDSIELTGDTEFGTSVPDDISDYNSTIESYRNADRECNSPELRRLGDQAKVLWSKIEEERASQRGQRLKQLSIRGAGLFTVHGTSRRRPFVCSAGLISLYVAVYTTLGIGGSELSVLSYTVQTFLFRPPSVPDRLLIKLLVYSGSLWKFLLIPPIVASLYGAWGRYKF